MANNVTTAQAARYILDDLEPGPALTQWLQTAPSGAIRPTSEGKLYVMTAFGHRVIEDRAVATALVQRQRAVVNEINRRRDICAALWRSVAYCLVALIASAYIAA